MTLPQATSAGALVLALTDDGPRLALCAEPEHGDGALVIPKGHVEMGESLEQAALREVAEEIGLESVQLLAYLGPIKRTSIEDDGETVMKTIHIFLGLVPEAGTLRGGLWVTPSEGIRAIPFEADREFAAHALGPLLGSGS